MRCFLSAAFGALVLGSTAALAAYPDHQVEVVIGFAPGGGQDQVARILAQELSKKWNQPVVVENKPGADTRIAADYVAHSKPDGYTIMSGAGILTFPVAAKPNYDLVRDFTPVIVAVQQPQVLVVNPSLPVNSMKELIALAKAKPGQLNYGVAGNLEMKFLMDATGMKMTEIQYKGNGPVATGVMSNEVQMSFISLSTVLPQIQGGQLKALAVSTTKRAPVLPDVPTIAESADLPGFDVGTWYGVLIPSATPKDVTNKIHDDLAEILTHKDFVERMTSQGYVIVGGSIDDFRKRIASDLARWAPSGGRQGP